MCVVEMYWCGIIEVLCCVVFQVYHVLVSCVKVFQVWLGLFHMCVVVCV